MTPCAGNDLFPQIIRIPTVCQGGGGGTSSLEMAVAVPGRAAKMPPALSGHVLIKITCRSHWGRRGDEVLHAPKEGEQIYSTVCSAHIIVQGTRGLR